MFASRSLECFLAVAEAGSVSAAARRTWVSQPAVSKQIGALERAIGARLFRRGRSGVTLTAAGERMLPVARDLVSRLRQAKQVASSAAGEGLAFRLACPVTTGEDIIRPFVASGGALEDIIPCSPADVYEQLQEGADLALSTWEPPVALRQHRLFSLPITVQSLEPVADGADSVELADLLSHPLLIPGQGSAVERTVMAAAYRAGVKLREARTVSNGTIAQARAIAGRGSAVVVEPLRQQIANQLLTVDGEWLMVHFSIAWEADHYAASEIEDVVEALAEWIAGSWSLIANHPEAELRGPG